MYVPGLGKVKENLSSVSSAFDLNVVLMSLTRVWGTSSLFFQVTVVAAATIRLAGPKLKLSILPSAAADWSPALATPGWVTAMLANAARTVSTAPRIHLAFLIFFFSF